MYNYNMLLVITGFMIFTSVTEILGNLRTQNYMLTAIKTHFLVCTRMRLNAIQVNVSGIIIGLMHYGKTFRFGKRGSNCDSVKVCSI